MHRHPVVSALVLATALAFVGTFTVGLAPHATAAQDATPAVASPTAASGDFAGLVDIGGRSLYLECHGEGSPTVVLEAGYRASARYWSDDLLHPDAPRTMVLPAVAEFTRVCAYDRPGTYASIGEDDFVSRSDPIAQPRTAPEVVAELHALLQAGGGPRSLRPGGPLAGWPLRAALRQHLPRRGHRPRPRGRLLRAAGDPDVARAVGGPGAAQSKFGMDTVIPIPGYGDVETMG